MNYYNKHIGDFNNATRHLTRQERSIYSDLLELQYDTEEPLPDDLDWICRRILATSECERTDVERMLNEYFDMLEHGWSNARCASEVTAYKDKHEKAIAAGKASGAARRRNKKPNKNKDIEQTLNGCSTDVEQTLNQPITNNHKPITNNQEPNQKKVVTECDFETFWSAYPKKKSKGQAQRSFDKLNPSRELFDQIIKSIEKAKNTDGWKKQSGKFIPYPVTWLNAQGWLDEIDDSVDLSALSDLDLTNLAKSLKIHTIGKSHAELRAAIENKQESM